ncbi:uncharacterized protein F5147DRAFT_649529 [Suillus discolor]|uniref:Uncharacterized protein n=1 Tax=Suillus discolor TaxID=1912936 RepID=A0A9P7JXE9_9AGAM|nr:uncharacterized protein F5147DRAFT_649529 [Suillus discolor]KAG2115111.1 hypothetical protein F5147DRAFT_649529 [Suillus discolor]
MYELMEKKLTHLIQEIIYLLSSGNKTATNNMHGPKTLPGPAPKSATELMVLVPTRGTKQNKTLSDDDNDKDYMPRKPRQLSESPIRQYTIDADGHEIIESGDDLPSHKKKWKLVGSDSESAASPSVPAPVGKKLSKNQTKGGPKQKRSKKAPSHMAPMTLSELVKVPSEEESDGQSALQAVQDEEIRVGAKRGTQHQQTTWFCTELYSTRDGQLGPFCTLHYNNTSFC